MDIMHILLINLVKIAVSKILERLSNHWIVLKRGIKKITGWTGSKIFKTYMPWCRRIRSGIYKLPLARPLDHIFRY